MLDGLQTVNKTNEMGFLKTVLSKEATGGVRVDLDAPTYPWHDMLGEVIIKGIGANNPAFNVFRGAQLANQFSVNDECWHVYHVPHDYVKGSDLFVHTHWAHNSAAVVSGGITITHDVSYAKSHDQAPFPADIATSVTQAASTTQYQHMLSEIQLSASAPSGSQIDSDDIEPDGVILIHSYISANDISVATDPFLFYIDIHYQSTNIGTKEKTPDFYA